MQRDRYAHLQARGDEDWPTLLLEDFSEIPFLDGISGVPEYQHRSRLRAGDDDLFLASTPVTAGVEAYYQQYLGLGNPHFLDVHADPPLAIARGAAQGEAFQELATWAGRHGRVLLHPYMSIEPVWALAEKLARESGATVRVVGPTPTATWLANDKAAFEDVVEATVGAEWLVESRRSGDPAVLADQLVDLARRHERVALKRLRCASAMGNLVLDSAQLTELEGAAQIVSDFLEETLWDGREEVLTVAWEDALLSPSTQWWIPQAGLGAPRLDGIYEQILAGERGVFVGSRPADQPPELCAALARAGLVVCTALQELGYAGRCSFDHLIVGDGVLRFTECNGRWGGTSTPMSFVDRVLGGPRPCYRAQDVEHPGLVGWTFPRLLERVGEHAYDVASGGGRFLFYNLGPLEPHGKLDVIALGESRADADHAIEELLPSLLDL